MISAVIKLKLAFQVASLLIALGEKGQKEVREEKWLEKFYFEE